MTDYVLGLVSKTQEAIQMNESSEARQSDARRTKISVAHSMLWIFLLFVLPEPANANDGDPVAIRYWPGGCSSIESMWNFHVAIGVDARNRAAFPRLADVEFVDDFWAASGSDSLVLDRRPNEPSAMLKPSSECPNPSRNAIRFSRIALKNEATHKALFVNVLFVDGVTILDSNKNSVGDLLAVLKEVKDLPKEIQTIDAFLFDDTIADPASFETLRGILKPRVMVLRSAVKFDKVGDALVEAIGHNTLSVSRSEPTSTSKWVKLSENPWSMDAALGDLFDKKEAACKSSRAVFKELSVNQLNFRPSNGTHTPRWNTEHMMGRELLFFSQIYHAVDSSIPILDLNPKQMPPDYRPAHEDWTGLEESMQMERVESFTRRFAYLLNGMDLNKTAKGSAFWTPKALLKQMEAHYKEHTANVVKKKELPDWPKD
jgi:hypothetical protein